MQGPIIAVDVSKGNSYYQGYINEWNPFSKARKMNHILSDFKKLDIYQNQLKEYTQLEPIFVFESTGVYHKTIQKYFDSKQYIYYIISPVISAKVRQIEIHANKTDTLDCANIAKVFYLKKLRKAHQEDVKYLTLRRLNRYYEDGLDHLRKYKVAFKSELELVFPNFATAFKNQNIYANSILELLKKYPHPYLVAVAKEDKMIHHLAKCSKKHQDSYLRKIVYKAKLCAEESYSGCDINDINVFILKDMVAKIQVQINHCDQILEQIISLARALPEFDLVNSIVGVGDNLAARLIAEIGDIKRFDNKNQLVAYAGLDPRIRQSGNVSGMHLQISKKGNKRLRSLLYLAVICNSRMKKDDPIYKFNQKKRQQSSPLKPKAANIATAHKLLVIVYGICKNETLYMF